MLIQVKRSSADTLLKLSIAIDEDLKALHPQLRGRQLPRIRAGGHADLEYCRRAPPPGLGRVVRGSPTRPKCTFSGFKHCRRRAITVCVAPATQKSPTESRVASHASLDFVFVLTKDRIPNTCKRPRCYWKSSPDEDTSYPRQGKHLSADHCPRAHPRLTFEVVL